MAASNIEEKVAILFYVLGRETTNAVLTALPDERSTLMRNRIEGLHDSPPSTIEIDQTLDEFEHLMRLATQTAGPNLRIHQGESLEEESMRLSATKPNEAQSQKPQAPSLEPSEDAVEDLCRLLPAQISGALADENAQTIAVVLDTLPSELAAEVLRWLPLDLQGAAFLAIGNSNPPAGWLLERILRTTYAKATAINPTQTAHRDNDQRMADMLRAMPKDKRAELLDKIEQDEPSLAERLLGMLFVFEDLLRIESRSLQRLLTEVDSETLLSALKDADEAIQDKVYSNVSKRVRANLMEEMELMGPIPKDKIENARSEIAGTICKLDKEGQLVTED